MKYDNNDYVAPFRVAVGLVHWPVLDKAGDMVCTNVTNFDIHDIARACRSFGVEKYYVINRMEEQLMFVSRILDHWKTGFGNKYNPMRATALGMVTPMMTLEKAIADFDPDCHVVATAARDLGDMTQIGFKQLREELVEGQKKSIFLVFGTGFGLHGEAMQQCQYLLEPIKGMSKDDYRHLSVRSAVSICLDRLMGLW